MTSSELQELIIATLLRERGGTRRRWRTALGAVRVYSVSTHPHCNWTVTPSGSAHDMAVIEEMLDTMRARHPLVSGR
ncbi:hypothetical protein [Sphingomonas sp. C3-2]|uniref:hypothetical protein n=1 Tax=Sphingomonas sp. C3-2 TaxID=3062169 RepID=UPI00294B58A7|nr:hypothetical protein [Sphingomonas sp. C3-2]WOK37219.1 hypothetical protein QYC26_03230 [Sphingomonas sp. C3-2]